MRRVIRLKDFFIFIFVFWYSTEILFNSTLIEIWGESFNGINNRINLLVFGLLMCQILFFQSYTRNEMLLIAAITIFVAISTILSGQKTIMSSWMFIVAAKDADLDEIIRIAYKILWIMLAIIISICLLGFIENVTLMRGNVERFSLGFSHPNQLGLRIFQLIACQCYVYRYRLRKRNYIYFFIMIIFLIRIPNSKTAYIVTSVLLGMLLLYEFIKVKKPEYMKLYEKGILFGYVCLNIFSILFSYIDVKSFFLLAKIDGWMSSRFSNCHKVWLMYGVPIFGQRIYVTEDERKMAGIQSRIWLDNAYVNVLLRYGMVIFLIFSIAYFCLLKMLVLQKQYMLAIILFLYALYGIMENGLYMITHNIFLIMFVALLYRKPLWGNQRIG